MPGGPVIGLVGKLPAHGDFIRRGGPAEVLGAIDHWLDAGLSRDPEMAERIAALDGWRFAALVAGRPVLGAMIASGDAVGRRFPAIATLALPALPARSRAEAWCAAAAGMLVAARDGGLRADAAAATLGDVPPPPPGEPAAGGWWRGDGPVRGEAVLPTGAAFALLLAGDAA